MGSLQNYISIQPMRFAMMISVGATPSSASARPTNKFHFHPTDAVCHDDLGRGDAEQRECSPYAKQRGHSPYAKQRGHSPYAIAFPTNAICHGDLGRGDAEQRECSPFSEQRKHPPCSAVCAS